MSEERALVLGGGGVAGMAWTTGILAGLADAGTDVTDPDHLLGTSAGAVVGAQLRLMADLKALYRAQVEPALQVAELTPPPDARARSFAFLRRLAAEALGPAERRRRMGEMALAAPTVPEAERMTVIRSRLTLLTSADSRPDSRPDSWPDSRPEPRPEPRPDSPGPSPGPSPGRPGWPQRPLAVVALDAYTGRTRVFDRHSGVPLADAVAASCAVPGAWPPVTIGDSRYIDGGVRSMANLDLAVGHGRVLVIAPSRDRALAADTDSAAAHGRVKVITPDGAARAAFGPDPLLPTTRTASAQAGYAQGRAAARTVAALWAVP